MSTFKSQARAGCLALVLASATLTMPAAAGEPAPYDFGPRGSLLTGGALILGKFEGQTLGRLFDASKCHWCGKNRFDGWFIGNSYRARPWASRLSDATLVLSLGSALVASHSGFSGRNGRNLGAVASSVGAAIVALQITKHAVRRQRPYAHEPAAVPCLTKPDPDDNKSFFSGHAAISVAAAVAAVRIRRHESIRSGHAWELAALGAAGATAVLRVAARKHYVTDIAVGASVGWAAGSLIPKWLERQPPEQALQARLAPQVIPLVARGAGSAQLGAGLLSGGTSPGVGLSLSWR